MADYITRIRTADGDKQIDYNALANLPNLTDATNTVISPNADYAEVGEWADGNPDNEDRLCYFVAIAEVGDNTIKIRKATSNDDVRGVTVYNPAFSGNASKDKYGEDGDILPRYDYVGIMGIVKIIDNGTCAVNGRCMPADDGTAIPSSNNMGYAVLERVDDTHVLIAVEPGADMIQRVKTDVQKMQETETAPPIVLSAEGEQITITDSAKRGFQGLKIYGKTTQNGTPTPDNPIPLESVGGDGAIVTNIEGGNLLKIAAKSTTCYGVTITVNTDNSITLNGTATQDFSFYVGDAELTDGTYTMSCKGAIAWNSRILYCDEDASWTAYSANSVRNCNGGVYSFILFVAGGASNSNITIYPILNKGSTALPYQPYVEPQQFVVATPNGLNGFPVSSGGNYTDGIGQQWICDEIDFERGVTKRRTRWVDLGTLDWIKGNPTNDGLNTVMYTTILDMSGSLLCSKFNQVASQVWENLKEGEMVSASGGYVALATNYTDVATFKAAMSGVMLVYELATPTETPLSAEEIEAYRALHTNYPTTIITSEGYANVKYVADTKMYIDNKFAQLATEIVNNA